MADCDISEGQEVGLLMRDGLLFATGDSRTEARGIAVSDAVKGEDVGISNIDGIVPLEVGKITIIRLPGIQKGGSRETDLGILEEALKGRHQVGAIGIEALAALRKVGVEPAYLYGVTEVVVEAARSGLFPVVVCVEEYTSDLLRRLEEKGIDYEILDARQARRD
jgi:putative transcriptional regulator